MPVRTRVVIQSRLSSSRLAAKAMLTVGGQPAAVLAALRAGRSGLETVLATSDQADDDVIAAAAGRAGVQVVRGSLEDPLSRFALAARGLDPDDVVVRLTADNVLPDADLIQDLVGDLTSSGRAYLRVGGDDPALPYGIAAEAFTVAALAGADANAGSAPEREHVTPWIRQQHGDARHTVSMAPARWAGLRCTIDTLDDYVRIALLFSDVPDPVSATWSDLCDLLADRSGPGPSTWPTRGPNPLGQTPLILGTVQLGIDYGAANRSGLPSSEQAAGILRAASSECISHIDTARAYGLSEDRIGGAISRGLSEHLQVVTKVRPLDDLPADAPRGWCRDAVDSSVNASLRALRSSTVSAILVHRHADWGKGDHGVRDALVDLRDAGICRAVGVSVATPDELLDVIDDPSCTYVQLPFNLLDRRWLAEPVQAALRRRNDVVVTCRGVYLQGLLLGGLHARWPTNVAIDVEGLVATLARLRDELRRVSVADLCLAYVLGQPWVTSVVVGAESEDQVRGSATLARRTPLTAGEIAHVEQQLVPGPAALVDPSQWSTR